MNGRLTRKEFIGGLVAAAGTGCRTSESLVATPHPSFMWAVLLHFGVNIQCDIPVDKWGKYRGEDLKLMTAADHVRFDEDVWRRLTGRMVEKGLNTVVIDLEEALFYPSHPELAVKGTWDVGRFRRELARLRSIGLEPIPKLNFSTAHDIWLKEYHRMVSTPTYYRVVTDVIRDVIEIFDTPRLFHIGFDEETAAHQAKHSMAIVRQGDLWWHDFLRIVREIESKGVRAWCWSDRIWKHRDEFLKRMPRSVLQSNWYYDSEFDVGKISNPVVKRFVEAYDDLERGGFDQVPTGSNWSSPDSIAGTVRHAKSRIASGRLRGFLAAPWVKTLPQFEKTHEEQIDQLAVARKSFARSRPPA